MPLHEEPVFLSPHPCMTSLPSPKQNFISDRLACLIAMRFFYPLLRVLPGEKDYMHAVIEMPSYLV